MIEAIGYKRFLILVVLAGTLGVFVVLSYFIFDPRAEASMRELSNLKAQISTLQADVETMRNDFAQFDTKKALYERISRVGFFNDQNRVVARERFNTLQKLSKIIAVNYEIEPAKILSQDLPVETGFVVMESPVSATLTALDDLDIYRFIYYLNYGFPGHITITNLRINRSADAITPEVLKEIGTGAPPELVSATLDMQWRTMARQDSIAPETMTDTVSPDGSTTGGQP